MTRTDRINDYKQMRELFLQYLYDRDMTYFTKSTVIQWYHEYKLHQDKGFGHGDFQANLHRLILRELQKQGRLFRIQHNLWQVVRNFKIKKLHEKILICKVKEEDEFDKYLREKLGGKE